VFSPTVNPTAGHYKKQIAAMIKKQALDIIKKANGEHGKEGSNYYPFSFSALTSALAQFPA
jgi:hypothetical protein